MVKLFLGALAVLSLIPISLNAALVRLSPLPLPLPLPPPGPSILAPRPAELMPTKRIQAPRPGDLVRMEPDRAPRFLDDGDPAHLKLAVDRSIADLSRRVVPSLPFGGRWVRRTDLIETLTDFRALLDRGLTREQLDGVVRARFDIYRSPGHDGAGGVLYTAYNDPVFDGALTPDATYHYPLYRPPELAHLANERFDRAAVNKGALARHGLELVWLKTPVEAYLFELEGSGLVRLREGGMFRVRYAASNGRKYAGLGAEVERNGLLAPADQARASGRIKYLEQPRLALAELARNPRVIFFEGQRIPPTVSELDLLPGRSVAVDMQYFPRGGLGFILLDRPEPTGVTKPSRYAPLARFAMAHDTGAAIHGPGRIDIYWGHDAAAQLAAGQLKESGTLYCLLLKGTELVNAAIAAPVAPPLAVAAPALVPIVGKLDARTPVRPVRPLVLSAALPGASTRSHRERSRAPSGPRRPASGSTRRRTRS